MTNACGCLFPYSFSYCVWENRSGGVNSTDFQQLSQRQGAAPHQDALAPLRVIGSAGLC